MESRVDGFKFWDGSVFSKPSDNAYSGVLARSIMRNPQMTLIINDSTLTLLQCDVNDA